MTKFIVAAYKGRKFDHYASIAYDLQDSAESFRDDCERLCGRMTKLRYVVEEVV